MKSFHDLSVDSLSISESETSFEAMQSRLYQMISYAKDRYHWYEDQRERKLSLALALGAVSGVSLPFVMGEALANAPTTRIMVSLTLLVIVGTAMGTIGVYLSGQNLTYTHRKGLASIVSWYNYPASKASFPGARSGLWHTLLRSDISPFFIRSGDSDGELVRARIGALTDRFQTFVEKASDIFTSKEKSLSEDLEQVFILYIFQTIARENLQSMVKVLQYGGLLISIFAGASILIGIFRL